MSDKNLHEYLPANLELVEKPFSKGVQWTMMVLFAMLVIVILWVCLGRMDTVAVAQGKVIPDEHSKVVQPLVAGNITAIHVKDGDRVTPGQPLIDLGDAVVTAEIERIQQQLNAALRQEAVATGMLATVSGQAVSALSFPEKGLSISVQTQAKQHFATYRQEYQQRLAEFDSRIRQYHLQSEHSRALADKLEQQIRLNESRLKGQKELLRRKAVSKDALRKEMIAHVDLEKEYLEQRGFQKRSASDREMQKQARATYQAEAQRQWQETEDQAHQQALALGQELHKAIETRKNMHLTAPVAGTVQALAVHTIGGVVQPGEQLMKIVPDSPLEIEAMVKNQDIGFVHQGQRTVVKVQAFPFSKYGYLEGTIRNISNDAVDTEHNGLVYPARIQLNSDTLNVDGKPVKMTPGMVVTAELDLGTRPVYEYFATHLVSAAKDSMRER